MSILLENTPCATLFASSLSTDWLPRPSASEELAPSKPQKNRASDGDPAKPSICANYTESSVILDYLQDQFGGLLPEGTRDQVKARALALYSDSVLGKGIREVIFEKRAKPSHEWDIKRIEAGHEIFNQSLKHLATELGENEYFANDFSIADIAITTRFGLAQAYGLNIPAQYKNLNDWFKRMKKNSFYQKTAP